MMNEGFVGDLRSPSISIPAGVDFTKPPESPRSMDSVFLSSHYPLPGFDEETDDDDDDEPETEDEEANLPPIAPGAKKQQIKKKLGILESDDEASFEP